MNLDADITPLVDQMTNWRRHFHQHPELGFEEHETSAFVADRLREWGIETHTGLAGTGVVGVIRGARGEQGPRIGLRADMDALPIQEAGSAAYRSSRPGLMHACGHDGHTAMLLGAAKVLAGRTDFTGVIHLIFQPAEEGLGGARRMIDEGLFESFPCDAVFALHNAPPLPLGTAAVHFGPACAGAARFQILVEGKGGHAALPHATASPISAAGALIGQIEAVPARELAADAMAVLTVASVHGGDAFNVVPDQVEITGTARGFSAATLATLQAALQRLCDGVAISYEVQTHLSFELLFPATVNHPQQAAVAADVLDTMLGADKVRRDMPPVTGSEDFAFMLEAVPGAYVLLGAGVREATPMLHHPDYDFEDGLLPVGSTFFVKTAERMLQISTAT